MGIFKKKQQEEVSISDAAIRELKLLMEEEDPEVRKQLAENLKAIRQAEIAEAAAKQKKSIWSRIDPNVLLAGGFGTAQILIILFGEKAGSLLNGRCAGFITKMKNNF